MYEICKTVNVEAGHRVVGHMGKCANLHGHSYRFDITLRSSDLNAVGFVRDFGDISHEIKRWDHKMLIWEEDPEPNLYLPLPGIVRVEFNPTAENMAKFLCYQFLEDGIEYAEVIVHETATSWASFELESDDDEEV